MESLDLFPVKIVADYHDKNQEIVTERIEDIKLKLEKTSEELQMLTLQESDLGEALHKEQTTAEFLRQKLCGRCYASVPSGRRLIMLVKPYKFGFVTVLEQFDDKGPYVYHGLLLSTTQQNAQFREISFDEYMRRTGSNEGLIRELLKSI